MSKRYRGPGEDTPPPAVTVTVEAAPAAAPTEGPVFTGPAVDPPDAPATAGVGTADAAAALASGAATAAPQTKYKGPGGMGPAPGADLSTQAMDAMFSPEGVGRILAQTLSGVYVAAGTDALSRQESELVRTVGAYWCQQRLPKDAGKVQPEILLVGAILATATPRAPTLWPKIRPAVAGLWNVLTLPIRNALARVRGGA